MANILIAEDEVRIASFVSKGLKQAGYQTQVATNGRSAIEMALSGQFDLILLDINLPEVDGWAILVKMRSQFSKTPIIVVTALDGTAEHRQSLNLGASDYITKPFRFSQLLASVRCHLQ
ncbi:MAG: response regulator transcription factor [Phormidesmis sp. RL_2_1]|nr:response regulator transcription factor [Phormidesmis sp. RL_2_1]